MKKIYLLALLFIASIAANAQCSPDTSLKQPGYYPDLLDTAKSGKAYGMVINLRIPNDTNVVFGGFPVTATFDSIKLITVHGLPTGFTYQCNVPNCTFVPQTNYCALISGTATEQQAGSYPLELRIMAYAKVGGFPISQPDTIRRFTLEVVKDSSGTTTRIGYANDNKAFAVWPNPASGNFQLLLRGNINETVRYEIADMAGRIYRQENITLDNGEVLLGRSLEGIATGVYMLRVYNSNGVSAVKFLVE